MPSSSIKQNKCKCGCGKYPSMSCSGYNYACVPPEIKQAKEAEKEAKSKRISARPLLLATMTASEERILPHENTFIVNKALQVAKSGGFKSLPELESEADEAVRQAMRKKYATIDGIIDCFTCASRAYIEDKIDPEDPQSLPVMQVGHFIKRSVKSLRWNLPHNIRPQCYLCNTLMHKEPAGKVFIEYRRKLILDIGEPVVLEMEQAHRRVFSPSRADLIELIKSLEV
jgi:hypothetical protein